MVAGLLVSATATPGAPRRQGVESGSSTISFERRVALLQRHFGFFFARLAVIALPISQAAPDDLDPTFSGDGGLVSTAYARSNADGSLDTNFGIAGRVTTSFGGTIDAAFAVKLQPNGKTVAARKDGGINPGLALPRYNTKGRRGQPRNRGKVITQTELST